MGPLTSEYAATNIRLELRWTHTDFTFAGGRTVREVTERRLLKTSGATAAVYTITHPGGDSAFSTRSQATLVDAGGDGVFTLTCDPCAKMADRYRPYQFRHLQF